MSVAPDSPRAAAALVAPEEGPSARRVIDLVHSQSGVVHGARAAMGAVPVFVAGPPVGRVAAARQGPLDYVAALFMAVPLAVITLLALAVMSVSDD